MTIEETVNKLAEAQIGHESRMTRVEESFKEALHQIAISIQQLTQLATAAYSRLDSLEEGQVHSDARFDALIDAQIQLTRHGDALTGAIVVVNGRFDKVVDAFEALAEVQARTDKQIRMLLDRNGATKSGRKSTKAAKKMTGKAKRN